MLYKNINLHMNLRDIYAGISSLINIQDRLKYNLETLYSHFIGWMAGWNLKTVYDQIKSY